jgi:hypothetical protein
MHGILYCMICLNKREAYVCVCFFFLIIIIMLYTTFLIFLLSHLVDMALLMEVGR